VDEYVFFEVALTDGTSQYPSTDVADPADPVDPA
jgi:hypothetical protein